MSGKITRRTFINMSLPVAGAVALDIHAVPLSATFLKSYSSGEKKKLLATTDYIDNVLINERGSRYGTPVQRSPEYYDRHECYMDRAQLDGLHVFLNSLGVTRHQWIVDTIWSLYEDYPHGFDLLGEAVLSAHAHDLEFYAEIKPFEGGGFGNILPLTMPFPDERAGFKDIRGIYPLVRPFNAANRTFSLKHKAASTCGNPPVSAIRLIKGDNLPTRIREEHLTIWTSSTNNGFTRYKGPVTFRNSVEKRYRFPYWRECRILHLEDLQILSDHRYILIRCSLADGAGDFSNEMGSIIELIGNDGFIIPNIMSTGPVSLEQHDMSFYRSKVMNQVVRYLQLPEVQSEINNRQKMEEHYRDYFGFGEYAPGDRATLDKEGYVAAACGKPEYIQGHLHPVYPEVRDHWLGMIEFCLDRGVDGINLRTSNHTLSPEPWDYGFNEPVTRSAGGNTDYTEISRINGDAYTVFLREAAMLVKSRGKRLVIHLETDMIIPDDRPGKVSSFAYNFEWQWETWIKEIAEEFELRGVYQLRPWNLSKALDIFSKATSNAGKPLYLQGDFHGMTFEGPFGSTEAEINLVKSHPHLNGYVFYETANITRLDDGGQVEGSPGIIRVLKKYFD